MNLNSAQAVIAVLVYRYCDSQRKRIDLYTKHPHLPYSNYFLGMMMGTAILEKFNISLKDITHKNFETIKLFFETNRDRLYLDAMAKLENALQNLFPSGLDNIDPRRLSAIFRRGDLLDYL